MKVKLLLISVVVIIAAVLLYLHFGGVANERIAEKIDSSTEVILRRFDERSDEIVHRLDGIESKLDRLLEIADRPLPDGLRETK